MTYVIDRYEGDFAVCEAADGGMVNVPRAELPEGANLGDVLLRTENGWQVDSASTEARARRIREKMTGLWD